MTKSWRRKAKRVFFSYKKI